MTKLTFKAVIIFYTLLFCQFKIYPQAPMFGPREDRGLIEFVEINEASGLAASRKNINVLWTHNDSGDLNRIFALNSYGKHLGIYFIDGVTNRDWEDIAVGPGPIDGQHYIYIGEIGDNSAQYELKYIYRVQEPDVDSNQSAVIDTIKNIDVIKFRYPDGNRDAETLMVDPLTKDIYIVSKREDSVRVYLTEYPQSLVDTIILEHVTTIPYRFIVGGDISHTGEEILLKTYDFVYYWQRNSGESVAEALSKQPYILPYIREPQGEAISWMHDANGYYTVSEELFGIQAHLFFYPRIGPANTNNNEESLNFRLEQNFPNPFNLNTIISWQLISRSRIKLIIYDMLGNEIAILIDAEQASGKYEVNFNAASLASGIYFYRLFAVSVGQTNNYSLVKSMTLLK